MRGKDGADPRKTAARHPNWSGKLILESATPRGAGKAANQRGAMRQWPANAARGLNFLFSGQKFWLKIFPQNLSVSRRSAGH